MKFNSLSKKWRLLFEDFLQCVFVRVRARSAQRKNNHMRLFDEDEKIECEKPFLDPNNTHPPVPSFSSSSFFFFSFLTSRNATDPLFLAFSKRKQYKKKLGLV